MYSLMCVMYDFLSSAYSFSRPFITTSTPLWHAALPPSSPPPSADALPPIRASLTSKDSVRIFAKRITPINLAHTYGFVLSQKDSFLILWTITFENVVTLSLVGDTGFNKILTSHIYLASLRWPPQHSDSAMAIRWCDDKKNLWPLSIKI